VNVAGAPGSIRIGCEGTHDGELSGTHVLVAVGRTPNSDRLGLEHLGVTPGSSGFIEVDEHLQVPGAEDVYVLGDLHGRAMFTHTARDDADVVYRNVYRGEARSITRRVVPHAVFTDPEVGAVGLSEPEARRAGYDIAVGLQEFGGVARARATGSTIGLVKFIVEVGTDRILGCHVAGPRGGELVHEAALAMATDIGYSEIGAMIHVHPTLAEAVSSAAGGVHRPAGA
jgi:pyruvate/2-oxoglutarate dehydrogenase complex dihydrolipoamide dehydrogenase (E3) component